VTPSDVARVSLPARSGEPVLDRAAVRSIADQLEGLDGTNTQAAVLLTEADDFCLGGDHDEVRRLDASALLALRADIARVEHRLRDAPFPIVGLARGRTIGGGVELLLACDLIVTEPTAVFSIPHVRADSRLGPALTRALVARVGSSWARRLLLLGEKVDGTLAYAIGLADVLTDAGDGETVALERAAALGALPWRARDRALSDLDEAEGVLGDAMRRLAEQLTNPKR
jgi:enoyl-CoA hydratase/carnithine racemase